MTTLKMIEHQKTKDQEDKVRQAQEIKLSQAEHDAAMQRLINDLPPKLQQSVSDAVLTRLKNELGLTENERTQLIKQARTQAQQAIDQEDERLSRWLRSLRNTSAEQLAEMGLTRMQNK